jgi:hypothetical protein
MLKPNKIISIFLFAAFYHLAIKDVNWGDAWMVLNNVWNQELMDGCMHWRL